MDSRSKFRPRFQDVELPGDPGTKSQRLCGLVVKGRRRKPRPDDEGQGETRTSSVVESAGEKSLGGSLESVRTVNRHRWARRAASGERVKRGQGTRHTDPVTSEEGVPGVRAGIYSPSGTRSQ